MPRIDFSKIEDQGTFAPIPAGTYKVEVQDVRADKTTKNGDEMWGLELRVLEGEYAGRKVWDNLVFSSKAMGRVKFVCSRLGMDVKVAGEIDLSPKTLVGRRAWVTVGIEETATGLGGTNKRNVVPWDGWNKLEETPASAPAGEGDPPF